MKNRAAGLAPTAQSFAVPQYWKAWNGCQPALVRRVYGASKSLIHQLFPARCLLCLEPGQPPALDLCRGCENDFPRNYSISLHRDCAFDLAFAPYRYQFPVVELIHRLKYGGQIAIARILGTLLARRILERNAQPVDAIVPVPLHRRRELKRGYNQAREIAQFAGELLRLPVQDRIARRIRDTAEQATLPASEREANLQDAFEIITAPPARVAILDDVLTTGATADALSLALRHAGCRRIEVWAVARA